MKREGTIDGIETIQKINKLNKPMVFTDLSVWKPVGKHNCEFLLKLIDIDNIEGDTVEHIVAQWNNVDKHFQHKKTGKECEEVGYADECYWIYIK